MDKFNMLLPTSARFPSQAIMSRIAKFVVLLVPIYTIIEAVYLLIVCQDNEWLPFFQLRSRGSIFADNLRAFLTIVMLNFYLLHSFENVPLFLM